MSSTSILVSITLALLSQSTQAASLLGLSFSHNDWEVACDNTRTCRAAGYQSDDSSESAVSVLLVRKAGVRQPVKGQLMIGNYDNDDVIKKLPAVFKLTMKINDRAFGQVEVHQNSLVADLSKKQVTALIAALSRNSTIEWMAGENIWQLSDEGAAAVLLKMDEFQGRIGTVGALVKKGSQGEDVVLPPLPIPTIIAAPLAKSLPSDNPLTTNQLNALRQALRANIKDDDCSWLFEEGGESELSITRLTTTRLLVSTKCWSGAYNEGYGYWVVNDASAYHPVLVTASGSGYSEGSIYASQKGRGLGDCWYSDAWTWDGKQFVHTDSSSTGMCKLLAPGGGWLLPTIITNVRHSPRP